MIRGYCSAVRSALTDDGRPPLEASGLKLHGRLIAIDGSLARAGGKRGLPSELQKLKAAVRGALAAAGAAFAPLYLAFGWVHRAAHILGQVELVVPPSASNSAGCWGPCSGTAVRSASLGSAVDHFVKVSRSYWPGLFACYDMAELPRTNNDLEQAFGSHRYHERRATGRKGASPSLVLRGSAKLVAGLATRHA